MSCRYDVSNDKNSCRKWAESFLEPQLFNSETVKCTRKPKSEFPRLDLCFKMEFEWVEGEKDAQRKETWKWRAKSSDSLLNVSHRVSEKISNCVSLYELYCKKSYLHLLQLTVFFNSLHTLSKLYTQIQELHTQNAKSLTSLVKWSTNTSQKQYLQTSLP